jgi:hypothetical protein
MTWCKPYLAAVAALAKEARHPPTSRPRRTTAGQRSTSWYEPPPRAIENGFGARTSMAHNAMQASAILESQAANAAAAGLAMRNQAQPRPPAPAGTLARASSPPQVVA